MGRLLLPLALAGLSFAGASYYHGGFAGAAADIGLRACRSDFAGGKPPRTIGEAVTSLCYRNYAAGFSSRTLTPLWSAERLTAENVEAGWTVPRREDFHDEPALARSAHADLLDYVHSGYDRGHMTPSADMPDATARDETFSLANVVPQNADNNRHVWSDIEQTVRRVARANGTIYVVTGPIVSSAPARINGHVAVPVALWKAVYVPGQGAAAYISNNVSERNWRVVPIAALIDAGVDPFPGVAEREKGTLLPLPPPVHYARPR